MKGCLRDFEGNALPSRVPRGADRDYRATLSLGSGTVSFLFVS
jgi:hypothetical protein